MSITDGLKLALGWMIAPVVLIGGLVGLFLMGLLIATMVDQVTDWSRRRRRKRRRDETPLR